MSPILAEAGGSVAGIVFLVIIAGLLGLIMDAVCKPKKKKYDVNLGGKITER